MWTNLYKAYDTLSGKMKDILEGMVAYHDVCKTARPQDLQSEGGWKGIGGSIPQHHLLSISW